MSMSIRHSLAAAAGAAVFAAPAATVVAHTPLAEHTQQ